MYDKKLPIYIDTYRFTQEIFKCTIKFPKEYKFMLGTSLNNDVLELSSILLKTRYRTQKSETIEDFLLHLEKIRLQLRLCADFMIISCNQQALLSQALERITGQGMAWYKSEKRKENNKAAVPESGQDSELS